MKMWRLCVHMTGMMRLTCCLPSSSFRLRCLERDEAPSPEPPTTSGPRNLTDAPCVGAGAVSCDQTSECPGPEWPEWWREAPDIVTCDVTSGDMTPVLRLTPVLLGLTGLATLASPHYSPTYYAHSAGQSGGPGRNARGHGQFSSILTRLQLRVVHANCQINQALLMATKPQTRVTCDH